MLLDRAACRPVASAASARHWPAIDCRVAMSTFTGPPQNPGTSRSAGTVGGGARLSPGLSTATVVVHKSPDGGPPASAARHHPGVIPPTAPAAGARQTARCWTLCSADGAVDVE